MNRNMGLCETTRRKNKAGVERLVCVEHQRYELEQSNL